MRNRKHNHSQGVIHLFIPLLIVVILAVVGYFIYQQVNQPTLSTTTQKTTVPTDSSTSASDPAAGQAPNGDLADWETYTNTKYKYTINYPNNYGIYLEEPIMFPEGTTINNATTIAIREKNSNPNSERMTIDVFSFKDISPEELANEIYSISLNNQNTFIESIEGVNNTTFVDLPAYQLTLKSKGYNNSHIGSLGPEGIVQHIVFERSDTTWVISLYKNKLFDQILSTFEFLED